MRCGLALLATGLALGLAAACTPNASVRTDLRPCHAEPCGTSALELHDEPAAPFALSYVEFDDQGRGFDAGQERLLFDHMARTAANAPLAIITFVHGWKHNAREDDGNVKQFRDLLTAVARFESQQPEARRRAVIGIYASWRGQSIEAQLLDILSFWGRKDAAQRVADGSLRNLLGKLRAFRDLVNLREDADGANPRRETRMLTIGHSFGGLIVYSALAQYYTDRAAASLIRARYFTGSAASDHAREKADPREITAYGDLVVVVNPAYEAMHYEPVRQLLDAAQTGALPQRFAPRQSPVLVQITSVGASAFEGDWATGLAFPIGRMANTSLQATRTDPVTGEDERKQIERAVGHYRPFWTHDLDRPAGPERRDAAPASTPARTFDPAAACRAFLEFERTARLSDGTLRPGWRRDYLSGAVLTEIGDGRYDPLNPFWVVRAHPGVVLDHNDIMAPVFVDFVAQLYGDIDRLKHPSLCDAKP
ncbi:MAG: hypothetical protein NVSMB18_19310 [Acetobacteraceae bacterium]